MSLGLACDLAVLGAYAAWTDAVPGVLLAALAGRRRAGASPPEAAAAGALLAGVCLHAAVWAAGRAAGLSYGAIQGAHAALVAALAAAALARPDGRAEAACVARALVSLDTAAFAAAALAAAAFFTYGPVERYLSDELLRLAFAQSALRSFPAQNPLLWTGALKYHYLADFFAATLSAGTGVPLPIVYFRFLLPFNWLLIILGLRALVKLADRRASTFWALAAFGALLLAPGRQLAHFTLRENTFALALAVLGVASLSKGLDESDGWALGLAAAATGFAVFAKAPCGCLYAALVCVACAAWARAGGDRRKAAATAALAALSWLAAYKLFISNPSAGGARLFDGEPRFGTLEAYFTPYFAEIWRERFARFHLTGAAVPLFDLDNAASLIPYAALPGAAAAAALARGEARTGPGARPVLLAALTAAGIGGAFYGALHYAISRSSDSYWVFFGAWLVAAAAYPRLPGVDAASWPRSARRAAALIVAVSLLLPFATWAAVRGTSRLAEEPWTDADARACAYLDAHARPDEVYLHNVLNRPHWTMAAFCGRRAFISYTEENGVWENVGLYRRSLAEAAAFFGGASPDPEGWLRRQGVRYVLVDRSSPVSPAFFKYRFLKPVTDAGTTVLYEAAAAPRASR